MEREVYSILLQYLDVAPVDTRSTYVYDDQYHWFTRLQKAGDFEHNPKVVNYKAVYMHLLTNSFNVDKAFVIACTENVREVAVYLSDYATPEACGQCVQSTRDEAITASVHLEKKYIVPALVARREDRNCVEMLLEGIVLEETDGTNEEYEALFASPSSEIVARHVGDELMNTLAHRVDMKASAVFDSRGHVYPIYKAVHMDLPNSVGAWLDTHPTQVDIRTQLVASIKGNKEVGVLLLAALEGDRGNIPEFAVRSNNYWVVKEFMPTQQLIGLARALGSSESLKALTSSSTRVTVPRKVRGRGL